LIIQSILDEDLHGARSETYLIFSLPPGMLRPLNGSFCLREAFLFAARLQAPDSVGKRFLYCLSHFWRVIVSHLPNEVIGENSGSRDIPR
jgi:hypothetical protein